jgi:putative two-component system response regulator
MSAFQQALREKPDLIVMDVIFPAGGAATLLPRLKQMPATRSLPVVFLTAADSPLAKKTLRDLRLLTYLQKPCPVEDLAAEIRNRLKPPTIVESGDFQVQESPKPERQAAG